MAIRQAAMSHILLLAFRRWAWQSLYEHRHLQRNDISDIGSASAGHYVNERNTERSGHSMMRIRRALTHPVFRAALQATFVLVVVFVGFRLASHGLVNQPYVRSSLENAISAATGHGVSVDGPVDVSFWPSPGIALSDVTLRTSGTGAVAAHAEQLSAAFSPLDMLIGKPAFEDFRLYNPQLFLVEKGPGNIGWLQDGKLFELIRRTASDEQTDSATDEPLPLGRMTIQNGSIQLSRPDGSTVARIDALYGQVKWLEATSRLSGDVTGRYLGEPFTLTFSSDTALPLLAGKNADVDASFTSALVSGSYKGTANLAARSLVEGNIVINAMNVARLQALNGLAIPALRNVGVASIKGKLSRRDSALRFDDTAVSIDGAGGAGILDLAFPQDRPPRLTGTLAFDTADLGVVVKTLIDAAKVQTATAMSQGTRALFDALDLDLRFSARQARFHDFILGDVAASIFAADAMTRLDIGDSDFEGGTLTGQLSIPARPGAKGDSLWISIKDANPASIVKWTGIGNLPALERASIDLSLNTEGSIADLSAQNMTASLRLTGENGTLPSFNVRKFRDLAAQRPFFPLKEAIGTEFPIQSLTVEASMTDGWAKIGKIAMTGNQQTIQAAGTAIYRTGGISLSGSIDALNGGGSENYPAFSFSLGGSLEAPVVIPFGPALSAPIR